MSMQDDHSRLTADKFHVEVLHVPTDTIIRTTTTGLHLVEFNRCNTMDNLTSSSSSSSSSSPIVGGMATYRVYYKLLEPQGLDISSNNTEVRIFYQVGI